MSPIPLATFSRSCDTLEFKALKDDAWYAVTILLFGEQYLRIKYRDFSDELDNLFEASDFKSLTQLDDFRERFRPLSRQLQDNECRKLIKGVKVCACYASDPNDVRFYDAFVDDVLAREHTEDLCSCRFILSWLHGPNYGNLTSSAIENICLVQPVLGLDPIVGSFLKVAREKLELASACPTALLKGDSQLQMVQKEKGCAKGPVVEFGSSQGSRHQRRMEESDLQGIKIPCLILIGNIDKQLCSSIITEFLRGHTSVSPQVFIFPSLPSEIYTTGAIVLDSEEDFQMLCRFLNDPNLIITSSTGRPWVILEKLIGLQRIKASIGSLASGSKDISLYGNRNMSNKLKVVRSGTREFKIASDLRDLFMEFYNHLVQLYKKLALEERKIVEV